MFAQNLRSFSPPCLTPDLDVGFVFLSWYFIRGFIKVNTCIVDVK